MPKRRKERSSSKVMEEEDLILSEERTILSNERTVISFMQLGLVIVGTGVVIATVFQQFVMQLFGYVLVMLGILEIIEAYRELRMRMGQMDYYKAKKRKAERLTGV